MKLDESLIKMVLLFRDEMRTNGISLVYMGEYSQEMIKTLGRVAETEMGEGQEFRKKRKAYHVLVETLQNLAKHSDEVSNEGGIGSGLFIIGEKDSAYYVITANRVNDESVTTLTKGINLVNTASKEELKEMYMKQIKEGSLSEKGGAGLGLIDMRRKMGKPFEYRFIPVEEGHTLFLLKSTIEV